MEIIRWNEESFKMAQKYEKLLHSAVYADYVNSLSREAVEELNQLYNEVLNVKGAFNANCSGCVITSLQRLGVRYFNEKSNRGVEAKAKVKQEVKSNKDERKEDKPKVNKGGRPKGSKNKPKEEDDLLIIETKEETSTK